MKNKYLLIGKILDFFMILEIRRSNLFKAVFRGVRNIFINRPYRGRSKK